MKTELTISLTYRKLEQLHALYVELLTTWTPDDDTERLLFDHARDMEKDLKVKLAKEVQSPRLVLSLAETRAFWMLWQLMDLKTHPVQAVLMGELLKETDLHLKQPAIRMPIEFKDYKNTI